MSPLNPDLHNAMVAVFGRVRVSNPGVPMTGTYCDWYDIRAASRLVWLAPPVLKSSPPTSRLQPTDLPADFCQLSDLENDHSARRYVEGRGFDPDVLSRDFGVGYSRRAYRWWRNGRLIIPLRAEVTGIGWCVVGWQARAIAPEDKPRYYTATGKPKSEMVYSLDRVIGSTGPVVICEGVTDVWRAGNNAIALLGKHPSLTQRKLIRQYLADRPLVVLLDPDAGAEAERVAQEIRETLSLSLVPLKSASRVVVAQLPDGRDPGDSTHVEIGALAAKALQ